MKNKFSVFCCMCLCLLACQQHKQNTENRIELEEDAKTPVLLGENIISTGDYETHAALSPSGDTIYFLKCMPDLSTCAICVSYKEDNSWSDPVIVPFSGRYLDVDPFITKDGNTMYFVSNRPYKASDTLNSSWDIWKVERNGNNWGNPVHLDSIINSNANEYYPTVADNGTLYFGSSRGGGNGGSDIYRSKPIKGVFASVENLGDSVNTTDNDYEAFIAPDESYLIIMATIPNGLTNAHLYYSLNKNGNWSKATKLQGPVNSSAAEWSPKVTRDGKYFYFGSTRNRNNGIPSKSETLTEFSKRIHESGNGLSDIYYVNFNSLSLDSIIQKMKELVLIRS
ncbi:MAG: PD40 domain-containing protein [Bacteroidetes bacterium]|nr:PD40 domain-containing protein [Bacteroidota bacterium]